MTDQELEDGQSQTLIDRSYEWDNAANDSGHAITLLSPPKTSAGLLAGVEEVGSWDAGVIADRAQGGALDL
ncbi:MAG: hypothetical protein MUC56_09010 [Thermoanaerobaculales bacterium]|jgi:hypothetical protein|nr:hypothetical protein [Thermoanaerobaculales bacterium]